MLQTLEISTFAFTFWLALYLLNRGAADLRQRYAGLGLFAYALVIALQLLLETAPTQTAGMQILSVQRPLLVLPAIFWCGAMLALLPEDHAVYHRARPFLIYGLPWLAVAVYLLGWLLDTDVGYDILTGVAILALVGTLIIVLPIYMRSDDGRPQQAWLITLVITLFFTLGLGLLLLPLQIDWLSRTVILLMISADLEVLGVMILWLDAYEQGEKLRPDMLRSFVYSGTAVIFISIQLILFSRFSGNEMLPWPVRWLLLTLIASIILSQTSANLLQNLLDKLIFANAPQIQETRAAFRAAETATARQNPSIMPETLPEKEFVRLTRRALGHMGNLPQLAASPLTRLSLIDARLKNGHPAATSDSQNPETLRRAAELKIVLTESISRLKPNGEIEFATTDEWRFYNAVYFPYVQGIKPYSRRAIQDHLSETETAALQWFQTYVPERTLYNWQNKAAALIAKDLRERVNGA